MARIRTIKPEFWIDEKLAPLDPIDRLVFLGLISQADDDGRLVDNVRLLNGLLFPETEHCCRDSLETLARLSRIVRYTSDSGQRLIQITNWEKHQRVDKPSKHTLPPPTPEDVAPQEDTESSGDPRESLATLSRDALAPILDRGPRTMDHGPGTEKPRDENSEDDDAGGDPGPDGPDGSDLPHPTKRMSASELVEIWARAQPQTPNQAERRAQKAAAFWITNNHDRESIMQAMVGMTALFEHRPPQSEPWDLNTLKRKFSKAKAKCLDHPELKSRRAEAAFLGGAA